MFRRQSKAMKITRMVVFTALIIALAGAVSVEAAILKINSDNNKLLSEMKEVNDNNDKITKEMASLETSLKEKQTQYQEQMKNRKIAYLTFDDGPSNHTGKILDILKKYDIKATFFVTGKPQLASTYKAIAEGGHILANHTYSHDYKYVYSSVNNFTDDVEKLEKFLTETTGVAPQPILRYPGGSNNTVSYSYGGKKLMDEILPVMKQKGYVAFDWNVDSTDASAARQSKDVIVKTVLGQANGQNHIIILMHDLDPKDTTVEALPEIIEGLKSRGYEFEVLSKDMNSYTFKKIP